MNDERTSSDTLNVPAY